MIILHVICQSELFNMSLSISISGLSSYKAYQLYRHIHNLVPYNVQNTYKSSTQHFNFLLTENIGYSILILDTSIISQ